MLLCAPGAALARLPVDPMYGKVLLAGAAGGCAVEAMQLVAMVSAENVFHNPRWAGWGEGKQPCWAAGWCSCAACIAGGVPAGTCYGGHCAMLGNQQKCWQCVRCVR